MANDVPINTGTAVTVAAEDIAATKYQRMKIVDGGVAGTIGVAATTGAPAAAAAGLVVWPVPGASVTVAGTVNIAPTTLTVNTAATIAGASVTIQQGVSVSAQISGAVSISALPAILIAPSAILGTVIAISGVTGVSSVGTIATIQTVAGVTGTTGNPTATAFGLPVWIVGGQTAGGASVFISGSIQMIQTLATVVSVSAVGTVQTVNSVLTVLTVATVSTILGTQVVIMAGTGNINTVDVTTAGPVAAASTALVVIMRNVDTTVGNTCAAASSKLCVVWGANASVGLNSANATVRPFAQLALMVMVSSTVASNANMLLMTIYTGTGQAAAVAGTSLFVVSAGFNLRINNMQVVAAGSASALVGMVNVIMATSAATVTVSAIGGRLIGVAIAAATTVYAQQFVDDAYMDLTGGQTWGIGVSVNTSCLIGGIVLNGWMF